MLVLSRKIGEQVLIPQFNITVTVLSVGPNRIQLGIKAPPEIDITRPEARRDSGLDSDIPTITRDHSRTHIGRAEDSESAEYSHAFNVGECEKESEFFLAGR